MKRRGYPANLLHALRLNEQLGTDYDYEIMPDMKTKLAAHIERFLTEREKYSVLFYYRDHISQKKLAEEFGVTDLRMRQIRYRAIRKLQKNGRLEELVK